MRKLRAAPTRTQQCATLAKNVVLSERVICVLTYIDIVKGEIRVRRVCSRAKVNVEVFLSLFSREYDFWDCWFQPCVHLVQIHTKHLRLMQSRVAATGAPEEINPCVWFNRLCKNPPAKSSVAENFSAAFLCSGPTSFWPLKYLVAQFQLCWKSLPKHFIHLNK